MSLWLAPAIGGLAAAAALADEKVEYAAPADCPSADEFAAMVSKRAPRAWDEASQRTGPLLSVEIRDAPEGKIGRLRRTSIGEASAPREVRAATCVEIVDALALTAALSLQEPPPAAVVTGPAAPPAETPSASTTTTTSTWALGATVSAMGLLPPSPMSGAGLFVENGAGAEPRGIALRRPDIRLRVQHARNDLVQTARTARFVLWAADLELCPLGAGLGAAVSLRACAIGSAGLLWGRGLAIENPKTSESLWGAAGLLARGRWALGRRARLELHAAAAAPLGHVDFFFETPRQHIASLPPVTWEVGLAGAWTIP